MTDKKITDLTALTGANVATADQLVIVDVSDTTMAATGTDKNMTADELKIALATTLGLISIDKLYDVKGDLPVGTGANTSARLAAGTNGQVLTAQSAQTTGLLWATVSTSVATDTIWDTKGDIAAATGADTATKLAAGSNGQVLTAQSAQATGLLWATPTTAATDTIYDAKGDLIGGTGADTAARLAVGTNTYGLEADSAAATGLKWSTVYSRPQEVNAQTGTTYTLVAGDFGKLVTLSNGSAITLTVPQDSDATLAIGTYVDLYQLGAGQVTVAAGTGATLRVSGLTAKARAQYSRLGLQKVSANTWSLFGDLAAS